MSNTQGSTSALLVGNLDSGGGLLRAAKKPDDNASGVSFASRLNDATVDANRDVNGSEEPDSDAGFGQAGKPAQADTISIIVGNDGLSKAHSDADAASTDLQALTGKSLDPVIQDATQSRSEQIDVMALQSRRPTGSLDVSPSAITELDTRTPAVTGLEVESLVEPIDANKLINIPFDDVKGSAARLINASTDSADDSEVGQLIAQNATGEQRNTYTEIVGLPTVQMQSPDLVNEAVATPAAITSTLVAVTPANLKPATATSANAVTAGVKPAVANSLQAGATTTPEMLALGQAGVVTGTGLTTAVSEDAPAVTGPTTEASGLSSATLVGQSAASPSSVQTTGAAIMQGVSQKPQVDVGLTQAPPTELADGPQSMPEPAVLTAGQLQTNDVLQVKKNLKEGVVTSPLNMVTDSANNMFQAISGGTITAPQLSRGDTLTSNAVLAPFTVPLQSEAADESLTSNIKWMLGDGVRNAVINIAPSGMGPISVSIDMNNENTNVSIIATQGATREALDAMLPRLREQLGAQGFENVRVDIADGRNENARGNSNQQQSTQSYNEFSNAEQSTGQSDDERKGESANANDGRTLEEHQAGSDESLENLLERSNAPAAGRSALYDVYV